MNTVQHVDLLRLREALEASWDEQTSYQAVKQAGNPALGQCYPTARAVQHYFPELAVVKGKVWNGRELETHFWNRLTLNGAAYDIDLTWQQFPPGSQVRSAVVLESLPPDDSESTQKRCALLLERVQAYLAAPPAP